MKPGTDTRGPMLARRQGPRSGVRFAPLHSVGRNDNVGRNPAIDAEAEERERASLARRMGIPLTGPDGRVQANFTRLETFGHPDVHWVRVAVDPDDPDVFSVQPHTLRHRGVAPRTQPFVPRPSSPPRMLLLAVTALTSPSASQTPAERWRPHLEELEIMELWQRASREHLPRPYALEHVSVVDVAAGTLVADQKLDGLAELVGRAVRANSLDACSR